jgi:steroid delta-isomerase-like uncharacterized protein
MADAITALTDSIEAFNAGDWDGYADVMTDDVVYVELATHRRAEGIEANLEVFKAWKVAFPDATGTIANIFGNGDQAVAEIMWTGTHNGDMEGPDGAIPATGRQITMEASMHVWVRDGKIRESHQYFDLLTMLTQIGAVPAPTAT